MINRIFLMFCTLLTVFPIYATNQIYHLSVHQYPQSVSVVFDSAHPLKFHSFSLSNKPRYVIDIRDAIFNNAAIHIPKNSVIQNIRHAYQSDNRLRFVFDLNYLPAAKITHKYSGLDYQTTINFIRPYLKQVKPKPLRKVVIVIDPGHGGKDPGASGIKGIQEKDIVLQIAKRLYYQLNHIPGFKAVLTRHGDYYLTLRQRLQVARKYHPDMFIAIHADAYPEKDAHGASVFALSLRGATSEAARWLAKKENASELMGGVELSDKSALLKSVLLNLSQTATIRSSIRIGRRMISALAKIGSLHSKRVDQAAFVVLKSPDIPSLLVETGFISNPVEERKLRNVNHQKRLAHSISSGIENYFKKWPPRESQLAMQKTQ